MFPPREVRLLTSSLVLACCSFFGVERGWSHGVAVVKSGGDLQMAIDQASPGDAIKLAAGGVFTGSYTLRNKAGTGWITIESAGSVPAAGVRATADVLADAPVVQAPGSNAPAFLTEPGAHNYSLVGLKITAASSVSQMTSLVNLGDGNPAQNTLGAQPHDIVIDHCVIYGNDGLDLRRGIALNSANTNIVDSTISAIHSAGSDAQAIAGWNGTGPYLIQNNYLEASGENVMFGGADPSITNALPSDITIRGNDFFKPLSWKGVWLVKNLLELKLGQRVLIENNTFTNNWVDAQTGFAINIKSTDQNGTAPWSNTSNVTFRNNLIENSPSGISIAANPDPGPVVPTSNVSIDGNRFVNVGGPSNNPSGALFQLIGGVNPGMFLSNIAITNNMATDGAASLGTTITFDGLPTQGLVFTGNFIIQGIYGIKGSGQGEGTATLKTYAPGAIFVGNTLMGGPR